MTERSLFQDTENDFTPIVQSEFDELLELQNSILGVSVSNNNSKELLVKLCLMAEQLTPESVASIMLYEKHEGRLFVHTAPSIPQEAIDALNGLQVGCGSCGNAVYHDEAMYVSNTLEDNRWCETRTFAETFKISACWSIPFYNEADEIFGTFALSSFEVRGATNFQRKLLDTCASIASVLLQKEKYLEQKALWEKETLRAEKLESIGVLAGGIAHDFNNLLGIVIGNLEMTNRVLNPGSKATTYITAASKASKRAAELTQQLLTFSKGGDPVKKLSDIAEVVRESAEFVLHGTGVALTFDCLSEGEKVLVADIDNGQIGQVIQNIIINARQAMNDEGAISVTFSHVDTVPGIGAASINVEQYCKVKIHDTGPGISADIIDKIFDPYFTTKSDGNGLGMASSFSIVKKHDGYLFAESEEGNGTCFTLYLPASDSMPVETPGNVVNIHQSKVKGRIMIMDDQEMLHEVAEAMLEELGYQTVHALDGIEAIEKYRERADGSEPIDVVIMDLTIPGGMGGEEAVQGVLSIDNDAKVIVCSGYSNDSVMARFSDYGFKGALSKPYNIDELDSMLNQMMTS
ncbi:Sensor protein of zinc sigma-54-dependent two-component system [hydrothermal vent metagenome]|uniref:Sensor protein of zinc sigma-54-dependent two-component system n=1 Tax=hydrothermal vent metagenome TaxID=652676 RepID=A0A3B0WF90_9ZZZZ